MNNFLYPQISVLEKKMMSFIKNVNLPSYVTKKQQKTVLQIYSN